MQAEPTALRIEDPGIRALFSEGSTLPVVARRRGGAGAVTG